MVHDSFVFGVSPPRYPHTCGKCGKKETAAKAYPCIEHRQDDTEVWFERIKPPAGT